MATFLSKWKGTFFSDFYSWIVTLVKGNIEIDLGEDGSNFTSTCKITYTGFYRSGQTISGKLEVDGPNYHCFIDDMDIYFTVNSRTKTEIKGTYSIQTPADHGNFTLTKV